MLLPLVLAGPDLSLRIPEGSMWEFTLTQKFTDRETGEAVQSFRYEGKTQLIVVSGRRWLDHSLILAEHQLDGQPLPPGEKPIVWREAIDARGLRFGVPKNVNLGDFRLWRWTWFQPPTAAAEPGSTWSAEGAHQEDAGLPGVRWTYTLNRTQLKNDRWALDVAVADTWLQPTYRAAGSLVVDAQTGLLLEGEWKSGLVRLPGGQEDLAMEMAYRQNRLMRTGGVKPSKIPPR